MIRNITQEEEAAIESAKNETGEKCASKAIMAATLSFQRLTKIISNLQEENKRLRKENQKMKKCVSCVTEAAKRINTALSEPDFAVANKDE